MRSLVTHFCYIICILFFSLATWVRLSFCPRAPSASSRPWTGWAPWDRGTPCGGTTPTGAGPTLRVSARNSEAHGVRKSRLEWKTLNLVKDGLHKATETKQFIWQPGIRKKIEFPPKTKLSKKEATFWCHLKASASEKTNTVTSQTVILNTAENS